MSAFQSPDFLSQYSGQQAATENHGHTMACAGYYGRRNEGAWDPLLGSLMSTGVLQEIQTMGSVVLWKKVGVNHQVLILCLLWARNVLGTLSAIKENIYHRFTQFTQ